MEIHSLVVNFSGDKWYMQSIQDAMGASGGLEPVSPEVAVEGRSS